MPPARSHHRLPTAVRRQQIARAALAIMAEQGLRRFTAAAVARRVGLSPGALFKHFPDKQAILDAAVDWAEQVLFGDFPPAGGTPLDRLEALYRSRLRILREHPEVLILLQNGQLALAGSEDTRARVESWKLRTFAFIRETLSEAQAAGQVRRDIPSSELALLVHGSVLVLGLPATAALAAGGGAPDSLWQAIAALLRPLPPEAECR